MAVVRNLLFSKLRRLIVSGEMCSYALSHFRLLEIKGLLKPMNFFCNDINYKVGAGTLLRIFCFQKMLQKMKELYSKVIVELNEKKNECLYHEMLNRNIKQYIHSENTSHSVIKASIPK